MVILDDKSPSEKIQAQNIGKNKKSVYRLRFLILIIIFIGIFFISFLLGKYSISLSELFHILIWKTGELINISGDNEKQLWDTAAATVFLRVRLPRVLAAAMIGAALSAAGASYQGLFRNPMVSPDILGASSGAGFGAALALICSFGYFGVSISAFVSGLIAVFLAYGLSRASRIDSTLSMVLSGMMISSLFTAATSFLKLIADPNEQLPVITYWLMGSLSSIRMSDVIFLAIPISVGLILLYCLRWKLNLLTVEDEEAESMGINTRRLRLIVIVCATLVTAACVSVSGLIGWIGLVIPHFGRLLFGYDYRRLMPASILMGASFLIVVDDAARLITSSELPIGILTAFIGAPVFAWLILTGGMRREN